MLRDQFHGVSECRSRFWAMKIAMKTTVIISRTTSFGQNPDTVFSSRLSTTFRCCCNRVNGDPGYQEQELCDCEVLSFRFCHGINQN